MLQSPTRWSQPQTGNVTSGTVDPVPAKSAAQVLNLPRLPRDRHIREFPRHLRCRDRYAWRSDALFFVADAVPAPKWSTGPFCSQTRSMGAYRARTTRLYVRMGQEPLNPFPHPHRRACQHARYVNGAAVLRGAASLRVTAAVRAGRPGCIGTGSIKRPRCARVRPASGRIEQGAQVSNKNP